MNAPISVASLLVALLSAPASDQEDPPEPRLLSRLDLERVAELHRLSAELGPELWPGFDAQGIPVAVNCDDVEELLVAHPQPPQEFEVRENLGLEGVDVRVRRGCTRYGPREGGWAMDLGGVHTAYVSVVEPLARTEDWLSVLLHESFHVFQRRLPAMSLGHQLQLPELDAAYCAGIALESRLLHAALVTDKEDERRELGRQFVACRRHRRAALDPVQIATEELQEFLEGTPSYVEARLVELLAATKPRDSALVDADPQYQGFADANERWKCKVAEIVPRSGVHVTFFHSQYKNGMAQGLLLDRIQPSWKEGMATEARSLSDLVEVCLPVPDDEADALRARAEARFDFAGLLREQQEHVDRKRAVLASFLDAPGWRLRVQHSAAGGTFRWKPKGPVHDVPVDESPAEFFRTRRGSARSGHGITIWEGGLEVFERGELQFSSSRGSVLFGPAAFEWLDRDRPADAESLRFESTSQNGDVHVDLIVSGAGVVLRVPRARVEQREERWIVTPIDDA